MRSTSRDKKHGENFPLEFAHPLINCALLKLIHSAGYEFIQKLTDDILLIF